MWFLTVWNKKNYDKIKALIDRNKYLYERSNECLKFIGKIPSWIDMSLKYYEKFMDEQPQIIKYADLLNTLKANTDLYITLVMFERKK